MSKSIASKIAKIMGELKGMEREGRNKAQKYSYFSEAQIFATIQSKLADNNLAVFPAMLDHTSTPYPHNAMQLKTENNQNATGTQHIVKMAFTWVCGDTGEQITIPWLGESADYGDKGINQVATSGTKYYLIRTFMISDGKDPDALSPQNESSNANSNGNTRSNGASQNGHGQQVLSEAEIKAQWVDAVAFMYNAKKHAENGVDMLLRDEPFFADNLKARKIGTLVWDTLLARAMTKHELSPDAIYQKLGVLGYQQMISEYQKVATAWEALSA